MLSTAASAATSRLRAVTDEASAAVTPVLSRARALSTVATTLLALTPSASTAASLGKAGALIHKLREQAGLTLKEVGQAVNLKDPELLAAAEKGLVALPFETILRLAAVLGRKDPLTAAVALTRVSNPQIWEALESLGIGKLVLQSSREREFMNVLRADDRARTLSDAEFAELVGFVKASVGLALAFKSRTRGKGRS